MNTIKAIWKAILAFIASWQASQAEEAQAAQEELVRGTQETIDQVPGETDEELLDHARDLGLVSGVHPSRAEELRLFGACDRRHYQSAYDRAFSQTKE